MTQHTDRKLLVVCDFDDSAAECNAAQLLLAQFAGPEAESVQEAYRSGSLPFREYQEQMFNTVTAPVEQLSEYAADNVRLRSGFAEAVKAARSKGGEFMIASAGVDFYIEPVLAAYELSDVPVLAVTGAPVSPDGATMSFRYDYPSDREFCRDWAICKCQPIEKAMSAGEHVIFIGDGLRSDSCAAEKVDTVFARSRLLEYCNINDIEAIGFEDFHSIAAHISNLDLGGPNPPGNSTPTARTNNPTTTKASE
ncbi:MAG: MtnX-like HAD-IB family phosphatase [Chloroflexi bacterium]|nr:MtnX-like HAD-IB family phosphatase [Chloroflexota bacterium]MBT4072790.1 MtnX-like HAD-IB family phosphatase [Chloroflexota bacterium]MBT4514368.1 MtnX-like HAD-IB family phosphatase [Chloroflexota bacterium]MBT6681474.1 MtnX-like HAD-IB family phosphatase [Chloroflexota bacterium]